MNEQTMKELLSSLAWFDASAYHNANVHTILSREFPGVDFTDALDDFLKCKTMPPGEGCPR